ncbi:MAG: hypothetical protein NT040_19290 [Bacteroidetes bacterium]|nr:hypothetical protein [Bacteroidota bacterium]
MKKAFFILSFLTVFSVTLMAQPAPPPPPASANEGGNGPIGGGAPIDGGLATALLMVAGFGAWKWNKAHKQAELKS